MPGVLAENCPEETALWQRGADRLTFAELDVAVADLALGLIKAGLGPGSRVVAWTDPSSGYLRLFLAAARAGLVVIPVDGQHAVGEVERIAAQLSAEAVYLGGSQRGASVRIGRGVALTITERPAAGSRSLEELGVDAGGVGAAGPEPQAPLMILPGAGDEFLRRAVLLSHRAIKSMCRLNAIAFRLPVRGSLIWPSYPGGLAEFTATALAHLHVGSSTGIVEPGEYAGALADDPGGLVYAHHEALAHGLAQDVRDVTGVGTVYLPVSAGVSGCGTEFADDAPVLRGWDPPEHGMALVTGWRDRIGSPAAGFAGLVAIGRLMPDVEARLSRRRPGAGNTTLALRSPALMDGYLGDETAMVPDGHFDTGLAAALAGDGMVYASVPSGTLR